MSGHPAQALWLREQAAMQRKCVLYATWSEKMICNFPSQSPLNLSFFKKKKKSFRHGLQSGSGKYLEILLTSDQGLGYASWIRSWKKVVSGPIYTVILTKHDNKLKFSFLFSDSGLTPTVPVPSNSGNCLMMVCDKKPASHTSLILFRQPAEEWLFFLSTEVSVLESYG